MDEHGLGKLVLPTGADVKGICSKLSENQRDIQAVCDAGIKQIFGPFPPVRIYPDEIHGGNQFFNDIQVLNIAIDDAYGFEGINVLHRPDPFLKEAVQITGSHLQALTYRQVLDGVGIPLKTVIVFITKQIK
jgi:hypothetical protein